MKLRIETLIALDSEMARARGKHPGPHLLMVALTEEVGEVAKAMLDTLAIDPSRRTTSAEIKAEAIQVAVVALRIFEEGDPSVLLAETQNDFPGVLG